MVLLITAAFASAAFALRPLLFNLDKTQEIKRENVQFYMNADALQEIAKEAELPMPYESLFHALQTYNRWLVEIKQGNLDTRRAMEIVPFSMMDYGLPDEVFGVLRIPAMELEMPIYLGANDENMASGAAVLTQTSIPIGGENTNAVIAGHRGCPIFTLKMHLAESFEKEDTMCSRQTFTTERPSGLFKPSRSLGFRRCAGAASFV